MKSPRRLDDAAVEALSRAVRKAYAHVRDCRARDQERMEAIYSQKSMAGVLFVDEVPPNGIPATQVREVRAGSYRTGSTTANLLTSRLRQIYVSTTPGTPHYTVEPRTAGAAKLAESQEVVSDVTLARSNLDAAMRRAAWLDPLQNYVGLRLRINEGAQDDTERVQWEVIESEYCGEEPFSRRFRWHARTVQWASLPENLREAARAVAPDGKTPHPWEPVGLFEVFDTGFALIEEDATRHPRCRVHVFINFEGEFYKDQRTRRPDLGEYVVTYDDLACPLGIEANMPAAPHEDVAPVEAATWMGLLDTASDLWELIRREALATNNLNLYDDAAISPELIAKVMALPAGTQATIPVKVTNETRGISHTMRPVERNPVLGEYISAFQVCLAHLDDVTGVGPQDRGQSINPSKTATEAGVLAASSSRSTAARLRVQQRRWTWALETLFEFQRKIYGKDVAVPLDGVVRTLPVPDPATCRYAFRIGVDEMDNLSRRGRLDSNMMVAQTLANLTAAFPQGMPKIMREAARRLIKSAGWVDADAYFPIQTSADGPTERYIALMEGAARDLPVYEDDEHMLFIAEYGKILERAALGGNADAPIHALSNAVQKHQIHARAQAAQQAQGAAQARPVSPGISAQGGVDNNIAAALDAGLPPQMSPQILR